MIVDSVKKCGCTYSNRVTGERKFAQNAGSRIHDVLNDVYLEVSGVEERGESNLSQRTQLTPSELAAHFVP